MLENLKKKINDSSFRHTIECNYNENDLIYTIDYGSRDNNIDFNSITKIVNFIRGLITPGRILIKNSIEVSGKEIFKVNFNDCTFLENVYFENCTFKSIVSFENSVFEKELCLYKSNFQKNVRFHNSTFKTSVNFENTSFHKLIDFYKSTFQANQQFLHTDFLDRAIFSNVIFLKEIQFLYNRVESSSLISFENTIFNRGLDISRANFTCQLHFWNSFFAEDIQEELFKYGDNKIDSLKRYRESIRIIKNELKTSGNKIDSLIFLKKEMKIYHKELSISDKANFGDKIILFFSKWSNEYGTKWHKGVLFTLFFGCLFYTLFLISINKELILDTNQDTFLDSCSLTLKHYFEFINITNWNFHPFGINNYGIAYLHLFVGRIFIGYGYFQTIKAFRKYGTS